MIVVGARGKGVRGEKLGHALGYKYSLACDYFLFVQKRVVARPGPQQMPAGAPSCTGGRETDTEIYVESVIHKCALKVTKTLKIK